jgi:hypothetical protein
MPDIKTITEIGDEHALKYPACAIKLVIYPLYRHYPSIVRHRSGAMIFHPSEWQPSLADGEALARRSLDRLSGYLDTTICGRFNPAILGQ